MTNTEKALRFSGSFVLVRARQIGVSETIRSIRKLEQNKANKTVGIAN